MYTPGNIKSHASQQTERGVWDGAFIIARDIFFDAMKKRKQLLIIRNKLSARQY